MRDYLKLDEVMEILEYYLHDEELCRAQSDVMVTANECLCTDTRESECCCGAWREVGDE